MTDHHLSIVLQDKSSQWAILTDIASSFTVRMDVILSIALETNRHDGMSLYVLYAMGSPSGRTANYLETPPIQHKNQA